MNYKLIYEKLISNAKSRKLDCYTESHHIIPRCLNGSDDASNLVDLTPEEHYVAHQLLVKIYPSEPKLVYAANMMTVSTKYAKRNNKTFGWIRRKLWEIEKNKKFSQETRKKMSDAVANKARLTCPHCGKSGLSGNMNRWHFDNCPNHPNPKVRPPMSKEHRNNISNGLKAIVLEETSCEFCGMIGKKCVIAAHRNFCKKNPNGRKKTEKTGTCVHCGKVTTFGNLSRWHNDNCKYKLS